MKKIKTIDELKMKKSKTIEEFVRDNCYLRGKKIQWYWVRQHVHPMTKKLLKELRDILKDENL